MDRDIKSMLPDELEEYFAQIGEPAFRARQVFKWLASGATSFEDMTDIGRNLRQKLSGSFYITAPGILRKQVSAYDGTIKYLWELRDGNTVESVLMSYEHGNTICVSSQVGCKWAAPFALQP